MNKYASSYAVAARATKNLQNGGAAHPGALLFSLAYLTRTHLTVSVTVTDNDDDDDDPRFVLLISMFFSPPI